MQPVLCRQLPDAAEPLVFVGIIGVAEQQWNVDALRQEFAHTANADLAVCEYHRTRHGMEWSVTRRDNPVPGGMALLGSESCSRTASTI
jgi:hypothetical protein